MGWEAETHFFKDKRVDGGYFLFGSGVWWKLGGYLECHEVDHGFIGHHFVGFFRRKYGEKKSVSEVDFLWWECEDIVFSAYVIAFKLAVMEVFGGGVDDIELGVG